MLDEGEYRRWISSSKRALDSARGDLERGDFNWACFKAQQAGEFAVKALLRGLGLPSYGHSVYKLLVGSGEDLGLNGEIIQSSKALDKLYVPTRYPNAWVEGTPEDFFTRVDAEEAVRHAEHIISWVEEKWRSLKRGRG